MADLPEFRLTVSSGPFTHTGVDYFGPMMVKFRRCSVNTWGYLFTCLGTRAIHLELADSLETDDFLLCLIRFIGRRGQPTTLHSDNGTNFRGADQELKQCLQRLKQSKIQDFLLPLGMEWHFNPLASPHMGGVWESLVKFVETALKAILSQLHVSKSVLHTALVEVEAVVNSRPLTHNSSDPADYTALTPQSFPYRSGGQCCATRCRHPT
jgi:transposase InsO family protein